MRKIIAAILVVIILVSVMTACGSSSNSFEKQIEQGNYDKAIEIYNMKLSGNSEYENTAKNFLQEYFEENWNSYKDGAISDQEFVNRYTTIEKVNDVICAIYDMDTVYSQYLLVKDSKDAYAKGTEYADQGEFGSAITALSQVIPDDTENYDNAQSTLTETVEKYQDEIIDNVAQLATAGSFEEAILSISEAECIVGYTEKLEACLSDLYTQKYTDSIVAAFETDDHVTVIKEYDDACGNDYAVISSDLTNKYSSSVVNYLATVDQKCEAAFGEEKDYSSAIGVLRSAIAEVGVDESLVEALDERIAYYQAYIPVSLTSLDYTQKATYIKIGTADEDEFTDVNGNVYDAETVIYPWEGSSDDEAYVLYNLNFNYSTLSGTIYRPYSSLSSTKKWNDGASVKIYGDDVLLYEAPAITKSTYDSYNFEIDVTGVRNLKIVMRGFWYESSYSWGNNPKVCMAEAMLQK